MKIIAINGSHRKGKNTAKMLEAVLKEAAAQGAEVELIELSDYEIRRCLSCNKCLRRPQCSIQNDDMAALGEKLQEARGIVLGSPVYWHNVTTLMKNFMDRTRWMHMTANMLAGKVGAAVTHAGLRNGGQETCLSIMEHFLRAHGLLLADSRRADGGIITTGAAGTMFGNYKEGRVSFRKGVEEDEAAIAACKQVGRNMVALINRLG